MAKMYDIHTDTMLTNRGAIIDHLVIGALAALTFSEKGSRALAATRRMAEDAIAGKGLERYAVARIVRALWCADVTV